MLNETTEQLKGISANSLGKSYETLAFFEWQVETNFK